MANPMGCRQKGWLLALALSTGLGTTSLPVLSWDFWLPSLTEAGLLPAEHQFGSPLLLTPLPPIWI